MKKYKGFSLIELMIVVAIIGILSLMAIPLYQDYITKINLTKLLSEHMHRVNSAMVEVRSAGDIRAAYDTLYDEAKGECPSLGPRYSSITTCKTGDTEYRLDFADFDDDIYDNMYYERSSGGWDDLSKPYEIVSIRLYNGAFSTQDIAEIVYYPPQDWNMSNQPSELIMYGMYIIDNSENYPSFSRVQFIDRDNNLTDAGLNTFYCGAFEYENPAWGTTRPMRRSIRPTACYGMLDRGSYILER